jgi:hypothetical protein
MVRSDADGDGQGGVERAVTLRAVTVLMAAVIGLTFLFGFGNVWTLALRLGVPAWVAPLVAPAVDLSVLALLLATRYLAVHGAPGEQVRPARRLLVFSSVMTLALNVADPLIGRLWGRAAFDAVGPLLLIGWAEVGPGVLRAIISIGEDEATQAVPEFIAPSSGPPAWAAGREVPDAVDSVDDADLFARARQEDALHWKTYQRPISAETLRKRLHVGAAKSRMLVAMVRSVRDGVRQGAGVEDRRAVDTAPRPEPSQTERLGV